MGYQIPLNVKKDECKSDNKNRTDIIHYMTNQAQSQVVGKSNISNSALVETAVNAIQDHKGSKIPLLDLTKLETAPTSTFIICQGNSTSQVSAIADNIREELRLKLGGKTYNYDGYRNSQWIVIDYGSLMVHVFLPDFREFYNIEDLWSDAKITNIPDLD